MMISKISRLGQTGTKLIEFLYVYAREEDYKPQLIDIFIEGKWVGSRRMPKQCKEYITYVLS